MTAAHLRLERIKPILVCPRCGGSLDFDTQAATCRECAAGYPVRKGKVYFTEAPDSTDDVDRLKARLKKWLGKYYYTIGRDILAPAYPFNYARWIRCYLDPTRQIVVDAGCGNYRMDEQVICLDLFDYDVVDIVCDLGALPFSPGSVDAFVTRSVLEHLPDPFAVVQNFHRCTCPGGMGLHLVPFLFPFHASPYDFYRYTHKGLGLLFKEWDILEQTNVTGPVTLGLLNTVEFLSIVFSLGRDRVKAYIYLILCAILFPLKYLDAPFVNRKSFLTLAPSILTVLRKRDEGTIQEAREVLGPR
ncbi:MAG: class I SAM-dependent methyltransferase [Chloroflexi bacterium]|nr:class I SAM-dependent methyltransferase [Chloroflexota bacterium]